MLTQLTRDMAVSARGLFRDRSFTLTTVPTLTVALSGRLVAVGAAVGLIVSFSVLGVLAAIVPLENVSILDARPFAAGTAILALAAALASFFPSRRAARIDPSHALRAET